MSVDTQPGKEKSRLTRRKFLQLGVAAATAITAEATFGGSAILKPARTTTAEAETTSSPATKESVEARGVILLTQRDAPKWIRPSPGVPLKWEQEHLEAIDSILKILPPHMYQENGVGIILSNTYDAGSVTNPGQRDKIQVDFKDLTTDSKKRALTTTAHELSHILTPMENLTRPSEGNTTYGLKVGSPWFDQIYGILGGSFSSSPSEFWQKIDEVEPKIKQVARPDASTGEIDIFERRFIYGMKYYPAELIGIIGEQLLFGKNVFMERFTSNDFFTRDQAEQLYNFGVNKIYRGFTFDKFPLD